MVILLLVLQKEAFEFYDGVINTRATLRLAKIQLSRTIKITLLVVVVVVIAVVVIAVPITSASLSPIL